jgi:hypothetical protein
MKDVCRGVIERGPPTITRIDREMNFVAYLKAPFDDFAPMNRELRRRMLRVDDFHPVAARGLDRAAVSDLPAGLAVKWRFGGDEIYFRAFAGFVFSLPVGVKSQNGRFRIHPVVADEADLPVELNFRVALGNIPGFAPAAALLFHEALEAGLIDRYFFAAKNVLGEIEWKSVRIVEPEGDLAREHAAVFALEIRHGLCQKPESLFQRLAEALLFAADDLLDMSLPLAQLGVRVAHHVSYHRGDVV